MPLKLRRESIAKPLGMVNEIMKNYWSLQSYWWLFEINLELLAGEVVGDHIKLDAVHKNNSEDVQILHHIKTTDNAINHLPKACFMVEYFSDGNMAILLLVGL